MHYDCVYTTHVRKSMCIYHVNKYFYTIKNSQEERERERGGNNYFFKQIQESNISYKLLSLKSIKNIAWYNKNYNLHNI